MSADNQIQLERPTMGDLIIHPVSDACPDPEELTDFADRSMPESRRREVQAHMRECSACAVLTLELSRAFEPIARLHTDWRGYRGAILYNLRRLNQEDTRGWKQHCMRCPDCSRRTYTLAAQFNPVRQAPAMAVAVMATLLFVFLQPVHKPTPRPQNPPSDMVAIEPRHDKSLPVGGHAPLGRSHEETIEDFVDPVPGQRAAWIGYLEDYLNTKSRSNVIILQAIKTLSLKQAADPNEKHPEIWRKKAADASRQIWEIDSHGE